MTAKRTRTNSLALFVETFWGTLYKQTVVIASALPVEMKLNCEFRCPMGMLMKGITLCFFRDYVQGVFFQCEVICWWKLFVLSNKISWKIKFLIYTVSTYIVVQIDNYIWTFSLESCWWFSLLEDVAWNRSCHINFSFFSR